MCFESVKRNCPANCRIELVTASNLSSLLEIPQAISDKLASGILSRTHFADYIRIALLNRYGGLWIDATVYVSRPFELDMQPEQLYTVKLPKLSDTYASDYRWTVSLIGCKKGSVLFAKLQDLMERYIVTHDEFIDFFLFDYFIALLYDYNPAVRRMIGLVEFNNEGFYELAKIINNPSNASAKKLLESQPFHKLSWKTNYHKTAEGHPTLYSELSKLHCGPSQDITPAISVVMPAYNAEAYIAESIRSVLSQDFEDFELIIADDCSTDGTAGIAESFDDERVRVIRTGRNTGSAKYPRELAIEAAKAPLICWIDSDDTVDSDYLSRLYKRKAETGAGIVCSRMVAERNGKTEYLLPEEGFDFDRIISGKEACLLTLSFPWKINLNGWLCDREAWMAVSTFKSLTINHMDADDYSAREMLFNAPKVAFSNSAYHYRLHPEAITKKVSPKLFESVMTWELMYGYFRNRWPEVMRTVTDSMCRRMIALMRLYAIHENELSPGQRGESKTLLKKYFKKIGISRVTASALPVAQKLILMMPFGLALRTIRKINK